MSEGSTINFRDEIRRNQIKSYFIIGGFFVFIGFIGGLAGMVFGGYERGELFDLPSIIFSIVMALSIALIYVLIFLSQGDQMILKATGAEEADRKKYPHLFHTTEGLAIAAGINPPPKCYVINDNSLNAYATGFRPEKSYIVVTKGLVNKLNREELEGVIAHEMAHIKNRDIKVMLIAAGLVGATVLLADILFRMFLFSRGGGNKDARIMIFVFAFWIFLIIISPLVGKMIQMAISRRREYLADATGAKLTRYPEGLASALEKIKGDKNPMDDKANKATAHLFISSPFKSKTKPLMKRLFSTHPPIEDRIARLRGQKN